MTDHLTAVIRFPGAEYTQRAVLEAARQVLPAASTDFRTDIKDGEASERLCSEAGADRKTLFFCDYDLLPFEGLLKASRYALCSSYVIRKALIRKHYLAHALHTYHLKHGQGSQGTIGQHVTPKTWHVEINFADELDELLLDDLYDLNEALEQNEESPPAQQQWFILKPAMADRGNGIRLFSSLDSLREIFEEFESADDDEDDETAEGEGQERGSQPDENSPKRDTAVMMSQLRHFVIQEYISSPLLLRAPSSSQPISARKFHLRAYVLCTGSLKVYLADEMLALFAPLPYTSPGATDNDGADDTYASEDLRRHLTNTCLQAQDDGQGHSRVSEENVFLFSELEGMAYSSPQTQMTLAQDQSTDSTGPTLSSEQLAAIKAGVVKTLAHTFKACATAGSINWQMWPNAFEVFGVDLLVEFKPESERTEPFKIWLLEINAQPDFAQTGSRLEPTIQHLFRRVFELAVVPFFGEDPSLSEPEPRKEGESHDGVTLCLDLPLSKAW
ncbi:putative tubulin--tyrosine ligase pby1 [Tilletia horrida]|nr:putative tubulin--tyrosine ligase pby1 [Tilletia horrida]